MNWPGFLVSRQYNKALIAVTLSNLCAVEELDKERGKRGIHRRKTAVVDRRRSLFLRTEKAFRLGSRESLPERFHGEHRTRGHPDYFFSNTAKKEMLNARQSVARHHDQIDAVSFGEGDDVDWRTAFSDMELGRYVGTGCVCKQTLHLTGRCRFDLRIPR